MTKVSEGVSRLATGAAAALAVLGVIVAVRTTVATAPLPGREEQDPNTMVVAGIVQFAAMLAGTATTAALLRIGWLTPRPTGEAGSSTTRGQWPRVRRNAVLLCVLAALSSPLNAAASSGFPIRYLLADPWSFMRSVQTAQAWLVVCIGAAIIATVAVTPRSWPAAVATGAFSVVLWLPPVVTATVSVGLGHDLATDAAILFTVLFAAWLGLIWAISDPSWVPSAAARRRLDRISRLVALPVIGLRVGIGFFELAGRPVTATPYGLALLVLLALLVMLTVLTVIPKNWTVALARRVGIWVLGVQVAMLLLVPPRFLVFQTPAENYLGFGVPAPPPLLAMFLPGRPNLLLTTVAVAALLLYWIGTVTLWRRGDDWPWRRAICWTLGWLVVLIISTTRIWMYSSATFSWHMLAHMSLNMIAPPLLVLGGPLTLALRVLPATQRELPTPRDAIVALMGAAWVQRLLNPLLLWVVFVGGFYLLYFSPLFGVAMRFHWAHQLMTFHFLIVGCLFYGIAIGVDRLPHDIPAVARLAVVFAAMPFHAFFAIAILAGDDIVGGNFYSSLDLAWLTDLAHQQQIGGQIAWATGELPLLVVIIALVAQWFGQDQRVARRRDRAVSRFGDDELAAYNDLLAELARRDEQRRSTQP